ncbi:MAG: hypothetical protein KIT84_00925 [Labilithrix sp.]|nr:hypothetical protein [Labilithrix sp.]MCW5809547.1 hypothetical protein [Labilithrix sp.]
MVAACNNDPFPNKSEVKQVRILAVRSDLPYARPGETVSLEALVDDGRMDKPEPMRVHWFKVPCVDPPGGQYFDCYPYLEAAYPAGVDLSPMLEEGTATSITIPNDALDGVVPEPGRGSEPAVTSWTFLIACGGHVERKPRVASLAPNQAPFGCFGADGKELSADHGVFGFTRVTVTPTRRNKVPQITRLVHRGRHVDLARGPVVERCDKTVLEDFFDWNCIWNGMDINFDESDAEEDPDNVDANGRVGKETLYVDWYVTLGRFIQPRIVVRDPFAGGPEISNALYEPTRAPGKGILWAVLHDNRGGVSWIQSPIEVVDGPDRDLP